MYRNQPIGSRGSYSSAKSYRADWLVPVHRDFRHEGTDVTSIRDRVGDVFARDRGESSIGKANEAQMSGTSRAEA